MNCDDLMAVCQGMADTRYSKLVRAFSAYGKSSSCKKEVAVACFVVSFDPHEALGDLQYPSSAQRTPGIRGTKSVNSQP